VVELHDAEEGVAPGQACVLYADIGPEARVLGGGTIARDLSTVHNRPGLAVAHA
jgi:tRNA-uridine 2-sulfurtransferase